MGHQDVATSDDTQRADGCARRQIIRRRVRKLPFTLISTPVPEIDIDRAHDDVKLRLCGSHEISYLMVGKRETVGLPIPQLFRNPCINATASLPKSGFQILDRQWYQRYLLNRNLAQPVRFAEVVARALPVMAHENATGITQPYSRRFHYVAAADCAAVCSMTA